VLIDLHTHSSVSDGTDSPADVMAQAAAAGLGVVALTDHDTTAGWKEAAATLPAGLALVPGVEISCSVEGVSLHLLGYLIDPAYLDLADELQLARDSRVGRAREMVAKLRAAGHPVTWEQVLAQVENGATIGRPHIADALVANGAVPDRETAFADLLHNRSPFYVRHYAPHPVDAVRLVRDAGGVPVFAHPAAATRGRIVTDDVIAEMAEAGLAGLEVDHPDHDEAARARLRDLAAALDLFTTGSSDFHGSGKPNRLGENTTSPEVLARIEAQASGSAVIRGV
jgi:predicted metal-dependent phosphoesterase TrpH